MTRCNNLVLERKKLISIKYVFKTYATDLFESNTSDKVHIKSKFDFTIKSIL